MEILIPNKMFITISSQICKLINNNSREECTLLGEKIADSLIKTATTRIFSSPEQSILELPINSIDSYKPNNPIGKFGMGFFSIFYWLAEDHRRSLKLTSRYIKDGKYFSYVIEFIWTNEGLGFKRIGTFQDNQDNIIQILGNNTGTKIELLCKDAPLSFMNLEKIYSQLRRLFDIKDVSIYINTKSINSSIWDNKIIMFVDNDYISVLDNAQGIPYTLLRTSLIIPSYSSKLRVVYEEKDKLPSIDYSSLSKHNRFVITVNDVAVIDLEKVSLFKNGYTFVIRMKNNTTLPVSRDDIIYNKYEEFIFKTQVIYLMSLSIKKYNDLIILFEMLDDYVKYSSQTILNTIISEVKDQLYSIFEVIYIPSNYKVYDSLRKLYPNANFVTHPDPRIYETEKKLDILLSEKSFKNIFKFKNVIFLDMEPIYETGGLFKYLFISRKYFLANIKDFKGNLISLTQETLCIPLESANLSINLYDEMSKDKNIYNAVMNFICTFVAKFENITMEGIKDPKEFYLSLLEEYYFLDPEGIIEFITYFNSKLTKISFDYSYGTDPLFYFNPYFILFSDPLPEREFSDNVYQPLEDKLKQINIRLGYWFIDLWPIKPSSYYYTPHHSFRDFKNRFNTQDSSFTREVYQGLILCLNESESLVYLNIMYRVKGEYPPGIGIFCINEIRRRTFPEELIDMTISALMGYADEHNIIDKVGNPIIAALSLYQNVKDEVKINLYSNITGYLFTCKSLINYLFTYEVESFDQLLSSVQKNNNIKLQILEIAINESTTRDFIEAVMTELIQNSLDAIRSNNLKGIINIDLRKDSISISDNSGIPDNAFTSLLIPFLSTKNPNDANVTGEIGTGFFNVFRQPESSKVIIDTVFNNKRTIIQAIPVLKNNLVDDIDYTIQREDTLEKNGTLITIFFNPNYPKIVQSIADAQVYAMNYLGFTGVDTYINNIKIEQGIYKVYETELGTIYLTNNNSTQSFVMTNNVPFSPLKAFSMQFPLIYHILLKAGNTRVIINFNKKVYTPVQSRTKVNISDKLEKGITQFINNGLFLCVIEMYNRNEIRSEDDIINNTSSNKNIRQLAFSIRENLLPDFGNKEYSRSEQIPNFYIRYLFEDEVFIREIINNNITDIIENIPLKYENSIISNAVKKWFSNKQISKPAPENVVIMHTLTTVKSQLVAVPFTIFQSFIDLYWDIYKTLLEDKTVIGPLVNKDPPQIIIGETKNEYEGYYNKEKHIIFLNKDWYNIDQLIETLGEIRKLDKDDAIYQFRLKLMALFSPVLPATTFIHELLHAVQGDEHMIDHNVGNLIINGQKDLSFDTCAVAVYSEVLKRGLINKFLFQ